MANTKKPRLQRKKVVSYSVTTRVLQDFNEICEMENNIPSNQIERIMLNYINTYNKI